MKISSEALKLLREQLPMIGALLFTLLIIIFVGSEIFDAREKTFKPSESDKNAPAGCTNIEGILVCEKNAKKAKSTDPRYSAAKPAMNKELLSTKGFISICGLYATPRFDGVTKLHPPSPEAVKALHWMTQRIGISANFKLLAGKFNKKYGGIAAIRGNHRYIIYDMDEYFNAPKGKLYWRSLGLLGHEIAHNIAGHTALNNQSSYAQELESDKHSGFMASKLGATLDQALEWTHDLSLKGSKTHPARVKRVAAVTAGWKQAEAVKNKETSRCVNGWIAERFELDYQTCRVARQCLNQKATIRLACSDLDNQWRWQS